MTERRTNRQDGSRGPRWWRRPDSSTLASVALHVVLGFVVWHAVEVPAVYERFLRVARSPDRPNERIRFVEVSPRAPGPVAGVPGGRPAARPVGSGAAVAVPPLVAPTVVPPQLPPVPAVPGTAPAAPPGTTGGGATGPLRGGDGPTRGVQPGYDDPRIWASEPEFLYAPKTEKERLDSAMLTTFGRYLDSLNANAYVPNKFERGDWTFERDGQKWGIDQQYIRLGRFSIPTAILALLPLNRMQPNPIAMERERNAAWMRWDIQSHAQAAMNEEQFRQAVRAIRDRKERERRQAARLPPTNPGPVTSPGERPPPR